LDASLPTAFVDAAVLPVHFAIASLYILLVTAFVMATGGPFELTDAVLFVIKVFTFVLVTDSLTALLLPDAFADFHAVLECARVCVAISPPVLAVAFRLAVAVLTQVDITICELV
jgi:hypothetical protein